MARVSASGRTGSPLTNILGPQLVSNTTNDLRLRMVEVSSRSNTEFCCAPARLTAFGTQGTALTEVNVDFGFHVIIGAATNIGSGSPTVGAPMRQVTLGAAQGSGWVWTWGENGLLIPAGSASGVTIICPTGTGQAIDFTFEWEE
jgi:hypothetical protein